MYVFERFRKAFVKSSAHWKGQIYQHVEKRALGLATTNGTCINTHSLLPFSGFNAAEWYCRELG